MVEIILIAIGLGMDALAVAVCKGLSMKKMKWEKAIIIGLYFGTFQAFMPIVGYILGTNFENLVEKYNHWVAFVLLSFVGINMILDAFKKKQDDDYNEKVDYKTMIVLALATSIDAFAVGISFAFLEVNILFAISIIGVIAFFLSMIGVKVGNIFGDKYEKKAEIAGGIILILMGTKMLLEHLNF